MGFCKTGKAFTPWVVFYSTAWFLGSARIARFYFMSDEAIKPDSEQKLLFGTFRPSILKLNRDFKVYH